MVFVQEPSTCDFADMPVAALRTNCINAVLAPEHVGAAVMRFVGALDFPTLRLHFDNPFQSAN